MRGKLVSKTGHSCFNEAYLRCKGLNRHNQNQKYGMFDNLIITSTYSYNFGCTAEVVTEEPPMEKVGENPGQHQ